MEQIFGGHAEVADCRSILSDATLCRTFSCLDYYAHFWVNTKRHSLLVRVHLVAVLDELRLAAMCAPRLHFTVEHGELGQLANIRGIFVRIVVIGIGRWRCNRIVYGPRDVYRSIVGLATKHFDFCKGGVKNIKYIPI